MVVWSNERFVGTAKRRANRDLDDFVFVFQSYILVPQLLFRLQPNGKINLTFQNVRGLATFADAYR